MTDQKQLSGVYAAALTPLDQEYAPALDDIPPLLDFLANRGCHGALLLGTTGEGPSFAPDERLDIWRAALAVRQEHPEFYLLAGTGTPSLEGTIELTRAAFDLGMNGVVVLPPYYYRQASEQGLYLWFSEILARAVPSDGAFFGYHIPRISGVPLTLELLARLKDAFPRRFSGIKDSSSDPEHARILGERFGYDLMVFNGNDRLFGLALKNHACGCITAMANLVSPNLRRIWDAHQDGVDDSDAQAHLEIARQVFDDYPPAPPLLKALIPYASQLPTWNVRPPLTPISAQMTARALEDIQAIPHLVTGGSSTH